MSDARQVDEAWEELGALRSSLDELWTVLRKTDEGGMLADETDLDFASGWVSQALDAMASALCAIDALALPDEMRHTATPLAEVIEQVASSASDIPALGDLTQEQIANLHEAAEVAVAIEDHVSGSHPASEPLTALEHYENLIDVIEDVLEHLGGQE